MPPRWAGFTSLWGEGREGEREGENSLKKIFPAVFEEVNIFIMQHSEAAGAGN